jgi:hypothetical protein
LASVREVDDVVVFVELPSGSRNKYELEAERIVDEARTRGAAT